MSIGDPTTLGHFTIYSSGAGTIPASLTANHVIQLTWGTGDVIFIRNPSDTYTVTLNLPTVGFAGYGGCLMIVERAGAGVYVGPAGSIVFSRERVISDSAGADMERDYADGTTPVFPDFAYPLADSTPTRRNNTKAISKFIYNPGIKYSSTGGVVNAPARWYVIH